MNRCDAVLAHICFGLFPKRRREQDAIHGAEDGACESLRNGMLATRRVVLIVWENTAARAPQSRKRAFSYPEQLHAAEMVRDRDLQVVCAQVTHTHIQT